jgi:hypothetical protein
MQDTSGCPAPSGAPGQIGGRTGPLGGAVGIFHGASASARRRPGPRSAPSPRTRARTRRRRRRSAAPGGSRGVGGRLACRRHDDRPGAGPMPGYGHVSGRSVSGICLETFEWARSHGLRQRILRAGYAQLKLGQPEGRGVADGVEKNRNILTTLGVGARLRFHLPDHGRPPPTVPGVTSPVGSTRCPDDPHCCSVRYFRKGNHDQ